LIARGIRLVDEIRISISELADAAGVSVRTVRYYITEGLLPPPVTAGAKSYYTEEHRDRLIVIGRLKDAYLPLREIRRQLSEMDDGAIHEMATSKELTESTVDSEMRHSGLPHRADEHGGLAENHFSLFSDVEIESPRPERASRQRDSASDYISRVLKRAPAHAPAPLPAPTLPPRPVRPVEHDVVDHANWRRIEIGDGAELLIREDLYHRRRDKVSWLVDWARKVLA